MIYVRFPLSLRHVEDLLHERGIDITDETGRVWWGYFGQIFSAEIRRSRVDATRAYRQRRWHLDETFVTINGVKHDIWPAVDYVGEVFESYVTKTRDNAAALKCLGAIGTRETGRWRNNRAENSHQPFRRRERAMLRFRRMRSLQKFASLHGSIHNHFSQERHLTNRAIYKARRDAAPTAWRVLGAG